MPFGRFEFLPPRRARPRTLLDKTNTLPMKQAAEDLWLPEESLSRTHEEIVNSFFDEGEN